MPHEKFHYKSLEEVEQRAAELGVSLPFAVDTHCLAYPLQVRNITFPNRLGIAPHGGCRLHAGGRTLCLHRAPLRQRSHRRQRCDLV